MKQRVYCFVTSAMLLTAVMGVANAQQCGSSITACGCTIASPGVYSVDADLNATQGLTSHGSCIDVAAKNVSLLITNGHVIAGAGTGTGVGIDVLSSADHLYFSGFAGTYPYATLRGWQYGLKSEATNVAADSFTSSGNTSGVLLQGAQGNALYRFNTYSNSVYGVWVKTASGNQIIGAYSVANGVAGVYFGCSGTGPSGQQCEAGEEVSKANFIYESSFVGAQNYGIAVERGSNENSITNNVTASDALYDLFDGNPGCSGNHWLFNTAFGSAPTANQVCIH
jgi:hypothetical protein